MTDLGANLAILMRRELAGFRRELELFPDDASAWKTVPGLPNSAANLALHVAGNLQHFVGAVLGGTGYVRDRPKEFSRREGARGDVYGELEAARRAVDAVLPGLTEGRLAAEFPEVHMGMRFRTDLFLTHLASHAAFHLGQAGSVRRAVTGDARSSGPVPLTEIALPPES